MASSRASADQSDRENELFIAHQPAAASYSESLIVTGYFEAYVSCGSQFRIWGTFPMEIDFKVVDVDEGTAFAGVGFPQNISWDSSTFEFYKTLPCNQRIREEFSIDLVKDLGFRISTDAKRLRITAEYLGATSNALLL